MSIKEMSYEELMNILMFNGVDQLSKSDLEDALQIVEDELKKLEIGLNDLRAKQLFYVNNMTAAKEARNEGELTFNYDQLMQEEKNVFELESSYEDCEKMLVVLNTALDDKNIDLPKNRN